MVVVVAEVVFQREEMADSLVEEEGEGDSPIDGMIGSLGLMVVVVVAAAVAAVEEVVEITIADGETFCISLPELATG